MSISAEHLRDILQHLNAHAVDAAGARRAPRVKLQMAVELTPCGETETERIASRIVDVSARGAKLMHDRPLTPGDQVLLHIPKRCRGEISILCSVSRCTPTSTHKYSVGVEFVGPVAPAQQPGSIEEETRRIRASILS